MNQESLTLKYMRMKEYQIHYEKIKNIQSKKCNVDLKELKK